MTIKVKKHGGQEIELGKRGDLILVATEYHGKPSYRFGKLDGIVRRRAHGRQEHQGEFVKFFGQSYLLSHTNLMDVEVPRFFTYPGTRYLNINKIDSVVNGLEGITEHLDTTGNELYRGHADILRRRFKMDSHERRK